MSSFPLWPRALALSAGLLLALSSAHGMDYADGAKAIGAVCPALVKRDLPTATPQDSQAMCSCMRETLAGWGKDYTTTLPTQQQWSELGLRAAKQCMEPYGRKAAEQQCIANATWRQQLTRSASISDSQFDRYCGCHANLTFDEIAKGLDVDAPESKRLLQTKSYQQCLAPLRAEKPAH